MKNYKFRKRKSYFILAAIKIINEEGIEALNARSIALEAGFNASSIYTYFKNLDYLENLASIHFIEPYTRELSNKTQKLDNAIEIYMTMWEIFLKHSFNNPYFYYNVFYSAISKNENTNLFKEYYDIFSNEKPKKGGYILGMMDIGNTENRGLYVLNKCVEENSVHKNMVKYINDIHIGYTNHVMTEIVKTKTIKPSTDLYKKTLKYIIYSMYHYINQDYISIIDDFYKKIIEDKKIFSHD